MNLLDWLMSFKMPNREHLDSKRDELIMIRNEKKNSDCQYMFNLLNKMMRKSLRSDLSYNFQKINLNRISDFSNIDIKNCDGYVKYQKDLEERGVKIEFHKNSLDPYVSYDSVDKNITIGCRWF